MDGTTGTGYKSYGRRSVWQWIGLYLVIAILLYGAIYFLYLRNNYKYSSNNAAAPYSSPTTMISPSTASSPTTSAKQKFTDSPNYKYAYKIFPGPISAASKAAMSGFMMQIKSLANGSTQINLVAQKLGYTSQTYTLAKGESLYFIEKFSGDDNPTADMDETAGDDTAVVVDQNGDIVQ
ncbi:MAG TPA: hypothetical protein VMR41_02730 [Patescibacteria group bacterium]|nr:hypothetical protein [Patescibacteria group bacterium]